MAEKMIFCKACGKEIAKSAKMCPHCGKSNKRPFWVNLLIIVGVIILIVVISNLSKGSGSNSKSNSSNTTSVSETASGTSGKVDQKTTSGPIAIKLDDPRDIPFLHNDKRIKAGGKYEITVDAWYQQLSGTMLLLGLTSDKYSFDNFSITTESRIPDFKDGAPVRVVFLYEPGKSVPNQSYINSKLVSITAR